MEEFVKGDVVVLPFPFSDLTRSKRRPALVVAGLDGGDVILCQITSAARIDGYSILLSDGDFKEGSLDVSSIIRPNRLFTADSSIIIYKAGVLDASKIKEVENELVRIMTG
jgi:mRNA interferase MazF